MNTGKWKVVVVLVVTSIIVTMLFASYFPWLAAFTGLTLLAGGVAYAAWSTALIKSQVYVGSPFVVYGVILLALSQLQIRANWRESGTRDEVAKAIEVANAAADEQQVEKALQICNLLDAKANADEKMKIADVRNRVEGIKQAGRIKQANNTVVQLVADGSRYIATAKLDNAQSALKSALQVPMATEFSATTNLANEIVRKRNELAIDLLFKNELAKAKEQVQLAISIPSTPDTSQTKQLLVDICNREVAQLVTSARESLASESRNEAEASLERALAIGGATETAEAKTLLAGIREAREAEASVHASIANARVSSLMTDAEQAFNKQEFSEALGILSEALAVPHSTQGEKVAAAIKRVQKEQIADRDRVLRANTAIAAEAERERNALKAEAMAAEAARKAEEEYESNGLVLLRKTIKGRGGEIFGEITGEVVNRRNRKVSYAEIRFLLYDKTGAQVGTALANIEDLEAGGTWKFKAIALEDFSKFKFGELTGF